MNDPELLKDTSSVPETDVSLYSQADYPEEYMPGEQDLESACVKNTQNLKAVKVVTGEKGPREIVIRINAKLMSRRDQVRQLNEEIKGSSEAR